MKKVINLFVCLILLFSFTGCSNEEVVVDLDLEGKYLFEFYFVESCSMCQDFKNNGIPYLREQLGDYLNIVYVDMDDLDNRDKYDAFIERIDADSFVGDYYGMAPMLSLDGFFAKLGIYQDEYEYLVSDIVNAIKGEELSIEASYNRVDFIVKDE